MASEIEALSCIMIVERSYHTPPGWRLATFDEVKDKLEMIKQQGLLKEWDRARLLDGWISGPGYNFQMGKDFRSCLGYMLLIQIRPSASSSSGNSDHARSIYQDVLLTPKGREVALFLCAEDCNYEVVYWLLNFWEKGETFNPLDVREGNIPFSNRTTFVEMNRVICHMGRILGEERLASEKAMRRKFSLESVKEVMVSMGNSVWDKFSQEHKKILGRSFLERIDVISSFVSESEECSKMNWFQEFASQGDTSDAIWNFLWYIISSNTLAHMVTTSLSLAFKECDNEECQTGSRRDFIMSTTILYYLSDYKTDEVQKFFTQACKDAAGDDQQRFNDMLENTSFAYYEKSRNYDVLNKILIYAAKMDSSFVVNKVLEWGAQPEANLGPDEQNMALYYAIRYYGKKEIVRSLFDNCHSKEQFANAPTKEGMTALHLACRVSKNEVEMVLEYGGKLDVSDNRGRLPLHHAVESGEGDVIDVLIGGGNSDTVQKMVTWKDNDGVSPLDMAVKDNNIKLMVKLLSVSQQALETYFDKVDSAKLLREFASEGNMEVVKKLLESGADPLACDVKGQTALHHASMCEDVYKARKLTELMLTKCGSEEEKKNWVSKQDDMGKTALHIAAMKGHRRVCSFLSEINKDILRIKDTDGRTALFEAVRGGHDDIFDILYDVEKFTLDFNVDFTLDFNIDNSGLTLLHVAASKGRKYIADFLLKESKKPKVYVRTTDVFGQTALHKAAKGGHADIIKVLLHWGAHPLLERDCDGRTVFHYFARTPLTGEDGKEVAELLLKKCGSDENKLLLLWASAAGLGTADQHLCNSPLKNFLLEQKKDITEKLEKVGKENNLLRTAACLGDIDVIKELLTRGAQIGDIKDQNWKNTLSERDKHNVDTVCKQIQSIAEQGNDQPTTSDNLGRSDYAHGLAALLLNPYLKPPITVGISGSWGMGKSSLMVQTEGILLKTAAQVALLPSEITSSKITISSFPGFQILEHTEKGRKKYHQIQTSIDLLLNDTRLKNNCFQIVKNKIVECCMKIKDKISGKTRTEGHSLRTFLNKYEAKYHHIFKSLAAMDSSSMFTVKGQQSQSEIDSSTKGTVVSLKGKGQQSQPESDSLTEGSVPAILTVRYNAWKYRNESEALAGMAVEITKGMEGIMTDAQWLSTCLRNTWRKQKQVIWIEIIFPCLLAVLLATTFTWILWLVLDRYKIKESVELKYASFPLTVVIMVWTLVKKVMSTVNPVSVQLMNYIKLPDHTEKLGYQERVISDITFLKKEISRNPCCLCTAASYIWHFITGSFIISLLSSKYIGENMSSSIPSANLRTIVFVDDLDRCQESIILQVLSAINLVLAVCEINVVLGMDKELIQRAIMKSHGDKSLKNSKLADKYLQKIIQLPLDLPDPSQDQSKNFLYRHLGVFQKQSKEGHSESETDAENDSVPEIDIAYNAVFPPFERSGGYVPRIAEKMLRSVIPISEANSSAETAEAPPQTLPNTAEGSAIIDIQRADGTSFSNIECFWSQLRKLFCINSKIKPPPQSDAAQGESNPVMELIPIRELLFVRYSEGERDAFCHFQKMATDFRKLPREWKRFLTYHRLVWNIFIINNQTKHLDGWQVQLIAWIFICWEFEENINILVQRWNEIDLLKTHKSESESESKSESESESEAEPRGPSLRVIVEHCIKKERWIIASNKGEKIAATSSGRDTTKHSKGSENKGPPTEKLEEDVKEKDDATNSKNIEDPESSNMERMKLKQDVDDQMISVRDVTEGGDYSESSEVAGPENLITVMKEKNDKLEKVLLMELDALKKEMKERVDALKTEIKEEMKEMMERVDALRKEINLLKEQTESLEACKNEKRAEEKKLKSRSWRRLRSALRKYDVSMAGIQAFQRFRFYCEAGHLQWPLHLEEEENEDF